MADIQKIKRNVSKMVGLGAPESEIDNYISSEGVSLNEVQEGVSYSDKAASMSPIDLSVARSKNDNFGGYLRQQASQPLSGESEQETFQRQYGGSGPIERPSYGEGASRAGLQGGSFAGGDELVGGLTAGLDVTLGDAKLSQFPEAYQIRRDQQRAKVDQFREDSPVSAYGAEIAGAIPTAMAAPLNIARGGQYAKAIGTGALQGGLYGAGAGEGDLQDQATSAGMGAALGGGIGAAGIPIAKGVGNLANKYLTNKAAQTVGMKGPEYQIMNRALQGDDSLTGAGAQRLSRAGPEGMLADVGTNAQALLDTAIQKSGPASRLATEAIDNRVSKAGQTLTNTLDDVLGKPGESSSRALTVYGDKTNPLSLIYKRAYSKPIDYSSKAGVEIESLINNNVPPEAINAANKLLRMEGHASEQILAKIDDAGNVIFEKLPDVKQIDYITRGLNQTASTGEGAGALGGQTQVGAAYQNLSRQIRTALKEAVPEYAAATNSASDAIRSRGARDLGTNILSQRVTRADLADSIKGMGKDEIRKVGEGLRMNIDDALANVKQTMTDPNVEGREAFKIIKDMSSRANREKVGLVLGKDEASKLFNQIDQASKAFELRASVAKNSSTFARQEISKGVNDIVSGGPIAQLREGELIGSGKSMIQSILMRSPEAKQQISDKAYISMVEALTGPRGQQAQTMLQQLQKVQPLIDANTGKVIDMTSKIISRNAPVSSQMNQALGAN